MDKIAAALVALVVLFCGHVITFAAFAANASAAKSVRKSVEIDVDIDYLFDVGDLVERFRLRDIARETVEQITVFAVRFGKAKADYFDGDFVGDEFAARVTVTTP